MAQFAGLFLGANAALANQTALRIVGNNIANAATPGFIRDELDFSPLPPDRGAGLSLGNGVTISGITQRVDRFLLERAREASGDFAAADARATFLERIEVLFGELTTNDISTEMNQFFAALQDVANRPDDVSIRSIVVERGTILASSIRTITDRIDQVRTDITREVVQGVDQINQILDNVHRLNLEVVAAEASNVANTAGGLRVLRNQELEKLGQKIDIRVVERSDGGVNVFTDFGLPLIFDGRVEHVATRQTVSGGMSVPELILEETGVPIPLDGGRLGGAQQARDQDLVAVLDALESFAQNLIFEFNKLHSSGQGLEGFRDLVSTNFVLDPTVNLDDANGNGNSDAGLPFLPNNGSFEVRTTDLGTGLVTTTVIGVDLNGTAGGDDLEAIRTDIDAIAGLTATITSQGMLRITADPNVEFSFADDTSGFLAAIGLNTFFTGRNSRSIDVNNVLRQNPALVAASRNGSPGDTSNAVALANLQNEAFSTLQGFSLTSFFSGVVADLGTTTQSARVASDALENAKLALESESLSITGVNLDEEAIKLIQFQRGFQASARFIATVNEMLEEIINLGR